MNKPEVQTAPTSTSVHQISVIVPKTHLLPNLFKTESTAFAHWMSKN